MARPGPAVQPAAAAAVPACLGIRPQLLSCPSRHHGGPAVGNPTPTASPATHPRQLPTATVLPRFPFGNRRRTGPEPVRAVLLCRPARARTAALEGRRPADPGNRRRSASPEDLALPILPAHNVAACEAKTARVTVATQAAAHPGVHQLNLTADMVVPVPSPPAVGTASDDADRLPSGRTSNGAGRVPDRRPVRREAAEVRHHCPLWT